MSSATNGHRPTALSNDRGYPGRQECGQGQSAASLDPGPQALACCKELSSRRTALTAPFGARTDTHSALARGRPAQDPIWERAGTGLLRNPLQGVPRARPRPRGRPRPPTARELGRISLAEALELTILIAQKEPEAAAQGGGPVVGA